MTLAPTETSWETDEVHLWLANDEPMYRRALECKSPKALARAFKGAVPGIRAWSRVDWAYIYEQFEEDRA